MQKSTLTQMKELTDYLVMLANQKNPIGLRFKKAVANLDKSEMEACYKLAFTQRQATYKKIIANLDGASLMIAKRLQRNYCTK